MTRKIYLTLLLSVSILFSAKPCGGWDWTGYSFDDLILSQELVNEPKYFSFLLDSEEPFYRSKTSSPNANILEWSEYLGISYDDAYYLVFKSSIQGVDSLLKHKKADDPKLLFAKPAFVKKHKEALEYLYLAKDFEPFMYFVGSGDDGWNSYGNKNVSLDASSIPYDETTSQLEQKSKKAKDKELKLRYAYQLVRLAHYNGKYDDAVNFFDTYVEPLDYRPEMYYYALSQKAGALRGLKQIVEANNLYSKVFSHSQDLKEIAVTSIQFNEDIDYENILATAKTLDEKNDADLLVGYMSFSNPLASAAKIVERSPDAVQAKVLVARAIAQMSFDYYSNFSKAKDRRFPVLESSSQKNLPDILSFVKKQADSADVKNKNYWNMTLAYLYFMNREFDQAEVYLAKVDPTETGYEKQKTLFANYIDIAKIPVIDANAEKKIFDKYITKSGLDGRETIVIMLANRYYLQKEYAKSFMLTCSLDKLMDNPSWELLTGIETYYNVPNKSKMDEYICDSFSSGRASTSVPQLISYMKGMVYLTENKLEDAKKEFNKSDLSIDTVPSYIFGYNQIECFTCDDNMVVDYLDEFPYIKDSMSEKELVDVLIKLEASAQKNNAKANYLLGNFFYNTSLTGYYRNFLRFGYEGVYRQAFCSPSDKNNILTDQLYFNTIPVFYDNTTAIADRYLHKAYQLASGDEFKARIVFALSKTEQELNYQKIADGYDSWERDRQEDWVMISNRKYFKEMMKYEKTAFFKDVQSNCLYFDYYVKHL